MERIKIKKNDVLKAIYFIVGLTQDQSGHAMYGTLSSKGDLMGGIFDRWINVIPESIIFNKVILPSISNGKKVEVISDFYRYDPAVAGIAPDVIGLRVDGRVIPLAQFNEKWVQVESRPQIEIKTFKITQKMVSLRNQSYDDKYLVMTESDFRIDYLLPFFDKELFDSNVYEEMQMDDQHFILSNNNRLLGNMQQVDYESDEIGSLSLLCITKSDEFMKNSTHCEGRVSVQRLSKIEEYSGNRLRNTCNLALEGLCERTEIGLYRFNSLWYDGVGEDNIPYRKVTKRGSTHQQKVRTLDFSALGIENIVVNKMIKNGIYITISKDSKINNYELKEGKTYKLTYDVLERENNDGEEYFMQKELVSFIPSYEIELKEKLEELINE